MKSLGGPSIFTTFIIVGFALYLSGGLLAYFGAGKLIFQPPLPSYQNNESIISVPSGNESISTIFLENPSADYTIFYHHGNAEDLGHLMPILKNLYDWGFSVIAYDYRGYGNSTGHPTEENTYEDALSIYSYLTEQENVRPGNIILLGRSLGGAVAIDLAQKVEAGGLIIESSFVSAYRVMTGWKIYPFDQYENDQKLPEVSMPTLVIHGKKDNVISFWHGKRLFDLAPEPKMYFWVEGASHNNLFQIAGSDYRETLNQFLQMTSNNN